MTEDNLFVHTMSVLTDRSRLKLVGLLAFQAYSLEELATSLGVKVTRVARQVRILQRLGLIDAHAEKVNAIPRYTLSMQHFCSLKTSWYASQKVFSVNDEVVLDENSFNAWEQEIIRRFFVGSRLGVIPSGRKELAIVVKWFAHLFDVGALYQEREVNEIIQRHYHDYAFFKKDLVGRGYLQRDHGIFRRVVPTQDRDAAS